MIPALAEVPLPCSPPGDEQGLGAADFRQVNRSGFGDGLNSYAHSMAWFRGRLYVGTTRGVMQMNAVNIPVPDMRPWPTDWVKDIYDLERRAQIWAFDPLTSHWTMVYRAPTLIGRNKREVPRYISFRGMGVFQGASDPHPCLYVSTWSPAMADKPDVLRCEDGVEFLPSPQPPWADTVRSFRVLQSYNGYIHTSPSSSSAVVGGVRRAQDSIGSESTIYCTDDLLNGQWVAASEHGFGEKMNLTVFEMAEYQGRLYAGTVNPHGFQLWRTEANPGPPPYQWKKIIDRGAFRGPHNEAVVSLCEFKGALYIGTGIANGGFHRQFKIGPAATELLRIWPDDSWELLMGLPRMTPQGIKTPLSGYGNGFDNLFNSYVWRMAEHAGWLYLGTFSWASVLPYTPLNLWPEDVLRLVHKWGLDRLNRDIGGFDIWRSRDGIRWECVTRSGFDNQYNWGARNFASTPHGLFVGTANPYGPKVAVQRDGKWTLVRNPRGGCEVFLGRKREPGA